MGVRTPVAAAVVLLVSLLLAPSASARKAFVSDFQLRASNGYRMTVFALRPSDVHRAQSARRDRRRNAVVDVFLLKPVAPNAYKSAIYETRGRLTNERLQADLGRFGRIAMRFRREAGPAAAPKRRLCLVDISHARPTAFRGRLAFRGSRDFTDLTARRARGTTGVGRLSCSKAKFRDALARRHGRRPLETELLARRDGVSFYASAINFHLPHVVRNSCDLTAALHRRVARVRVELFADATGKPRHFTFNHALTRAEVSAARGPLWGSAEFRTRTRWRRPLWRGSLRADLPGNPNMRLAGRGFRARLRRF